MEQNTLSVALLTVGIVLVVTLSVLISRRRSRTPRARLAAGCNALLEQIVVPDGEGGHVHIEYALLCSRGIVLVTIKDIAGNVFGGDSMQEWAVITEKTRFAFANPQDGLYDRLAAVRGLIPDVPVHGYIAFTGKAEFTKGVPSDVVMFDEFVEQLQAEQAQATAVDAFLPSWEQLKTAADRP